MKIRTIFLLLENGLTDFVDYTFSTYLKQKQNAQ